MKIMMTVAGEAISPEAEAVVRAAISGSTDVTGLSPAEAVHAVAGVALPAGWQWMAKVTDDGGTLWQHGHLTARPLIVGEPDGDLRKRVEELARDQEILAENRDQDATDVEARGNETGWANLTSLAEVHRLVAESLREILAGGAR